MEFFIEQIRLILPVLGLEFFRESPKPSRQTTSTALAKENDGPVFELTHKKTGISARAREIDGDFVVLAGSLAVPDWTSKAKANASHSYETLGRRIIARAAHQRAGGVHKDQLIRRFHDRYNRGPKVVVASGSSTVPGIAAN